MVLGLVGDRGEAMSDLRGDIMDSVHHVEPELRRRWQLYLVKPHLSKRVRKALTLRSVQRPSTRRRRAGSLTTP